MKTFFPTLVLSLLLCGITARAQFIENKGQVLDVNQNVRPEVQFYYDAPRTSVYFLKNRVVYAFREEDKFDPAPYLNNARATDSIRATLGYTMHRLDMEFVGANPDPVIEKGEKIPGGLHFYLNKRNGIRDVGSYKTVTYKNLYDRVDVVFYELPTGLKYDIVLHEGARIEDVKIRYDGAEDIRLENRKALIKTRYQTLEEAIPLAYMDGDRNNKADIGYLLDAGGVLSFEKPGARFRTLTIDPVLEWATYFNGSAAASGSLSYDQNHLDDQGNFYIHGIAANSANNYPVVNPGGSAYVSAYNAGYDLYIAKFNANRALVWGTYLGGSGSEYSYGSNSMASRGNILHLVGEGMSAGAPFTNGGGFYQATADRNFWARFDLTTGQLLHLTTLGGGYKPSIAVSNAGLVAIIRDAYDFNNPVVMNRAGAFNQATNGGFKDMFLMMFNASYAQIWGTFLGGPGTQENFMCTFDNNENLFFVGENNWSSGSTPTTEKLVNLPGAYYQSAIAGGTDVTLGKFNPSGALVWHTLYGGNNSDARQGQQGGYAKILLHPATQELMLLFNTTSSNLTTLNVPGAYYKTVPTYPDFGGSGGSFWNYAAYIAKFSTAGALNYATYWYNTTGGDLIFDATFGGCDKFYVAGRVDYNTAVTQPLSAGFNLPNGQQTFLMQMNSNTYASEWTSFLANNASMQPSVSGLPNTPRLYVSANGYYSNGPTVDPGNGAYYQASNINQPPGNPGAFAYNYMIWQLHPSLPPDVTGNLSLCSGDNTVLTASGGTGAPYNWYAGASGGTAFYTGATYTTPALSSGTTYYVSSGSGMCESPRVPVAVVVNPGGGTPFTVTGGGNFCFGGAGVPVGLNGSQAGVNYQLQVGGINTGTPVAGNGSAISFGNQTAPGIYTVVIPGGGGSCSGNMTGSVTVTVTATPSTPNFTVNSPICAGGTISFDAPTVPGGAYHWTGPGGFTSAAEDPSITGATTAHTGTYSVYVTENTCTSATASQTVTVNPVPATPAFSVNSPVCSGATLNFSGPAVTGAVYVWSGPGGFTSSVQNPSITNVTAADAGTYNLQVVQAGCTSAVAVQNVVVNPSPVIAAGTVTPPSGCGAGNGSIQITGTGTGHIGWTGTHTGAAPGVTLPYNITSLSAGTYTVAFVSAAGCTSNVVTTVLTDPGAPATPAFTANTPVCEGQNLSLSATPVTGAAYVWSGPNGFGSNLVNPVVNTVTAAAAGTYSLYVVVAGCTSATATQTVTVNPTPALPSFTHNAPLCSGATLNLDGPTVTGAGYVWSGPGGFASSLEDPSITGAGTAASGTYSLYVYLNGCTSATATQNIVIHPTPVIAQGTVVDPTGCGTGNGSIQITGTGTGHIGWTGSATGAATGITLPYNITSLSAGTYTVAFVSAAGCTSNVVTATLSNPAPPATPVFTAGSPVCSGQNLNLSATPVTGAVYVWSGPNGFGSNLVNPVVNTVTTAATGTYSLYVVVNGCTSATATQTVTVNPTPALPTFTHNGPLCTGATLLFDGPALPGATYVWSGPGGFASAVENPSITGATAAATGTYSLYVQVNGCTSATAGQTVTVYDLPPAPAVSYNAPLCEGATLMLSAATPGVTAYVWNGPGGWTSTLQNPTVPNAGTASAGTYSVYAQLGNCTSATATLQVVIAPSPGAAYTGPVESCGRNVVLSVSTSPATGNGIHWYMPGPGPQGSPAPYTYGGPLPGTLDGFVETVNAAGCKDTAVFSIQFHDMPVAQFNYVGLCDGASVELQEQHGWNGNGGVTPGYAWSWNGGASAQANPSAHFGGPGTYGVTLVVTNPGTPCKDTLTKTVRVLPMAQPAFTYTAACLQEVFFKGTVNPDSAVTQVAWTFGDGETAAADSVSHTYKQDGGYTVSYTVTLADGCAYPVSQNITVALSKQSIPADLPNVFTPNNDPVNNHIDFDEILGECGEYEAKIYNRWGAPVFTQTKGTAPFAGKTPAGTDLSEGVYYYVLRYGGSQKGGSITLAR